MPVQQQPMTPMPFYADPNRFSTPVWQTDPSQVSGWQGQFIQQIPAGQPIETYQQYPNGIYQTTYQQPAFESNTFYTGAVQVLTPTNARPPSAPSQQAQMIPQRPNSNYAHTPSPGPTSQQGQSQAQQQQQTQQAQAQQQTTNRSYQDYNQFGNNASNDGSQSRPSSVNSVVNQNPPTPNQNYTQSNQQQNQQQQQQQSQQQQTQTVYTTVSAANFSPSSNQQQTQFVNANSGNGQPGYPQVNASSPQVVSHNSSGYSGNDQFGGHDSHQQWQSQDHQQLLWEQQQHQQQQQQQQQHQQQQHQQHQQQMQESKMEQHNYQQQAEQQQQQQQHVQYMTQQQKDHSDLNSPNKMQSDNMQRTFSQADKVNLNTRIKTMILNKQQNDAKMEQDVKNVDQNNTTGHFLWYSHHQHLKPFSADGGPLHVNLPCNDGKLLLSKNTHNFAQNNVNNPRYNALPLRMQRPFHHNHNKKQVSLTAPHDGNYLSERKFDTFKTELSEDEQTYTLSPKKNRVSRIEEDDMTRPNQHLQIPIKEINRAEDVSVPADNNFDRGNQILKKHSTASTSFTYGPRETRNIVAEDVSVPADNNFDRGNQILKKHSTASTCFTYGPRETRNIVGTPDSFAYGSPDSRSSTPIQSMNNSVQSPSVSSVTSPRHPTTEQFFMNSSKSFQSSSRLHRENHFFAPPLPHMPVDKRVPRLQGGNAANNHHEVVPPKRNSSNESSERTIYESPVTSNTKDRRAIKTDDKYSKSTNHASRSREQIKSLIMHKSPPKIIGEEIPRCHCFTSDQSPPEPGTYYTHLGCANNLKTLRHNLECQTGVNGTAIRIERVRYTGKEGKTAQGCPIVKWVHRRVSLEEKYLVVVKHRTGHFCHSAFIVICLVVWDGVSQSDSDDLYSLLTSKITKFGLPTKRRCATNDPRTCACQGVNEDTCGASFTFGCSWSMYYNGCKFTRSKDVRKFRLSVKEEERLLEEKLQNLADHLSPIYKTLAPQSFCNQTSFEHVASECRLGNQPGRPFSGVTACLDFCAHAHKDIHNMNNGCTVVVTLTKHRDRSKPDDEQFHVLPLYVPEDTDEFGSKERQDMKVRIGEIEVLDKFESEVRTFSEPAEKCKNRKGKKEESQRKRKSATPQPSSPSVSSTTLLQSPKDPSSAYNNSEIQSGQVSSTVLDSPNRTPSWRYDNFISNNESSFGVHSTGNNFSNHLPQFSFFKMPNSPDSGSFSNHYSQDGYLNSYAKPRSGNIAQHPTPYLYSNFTQSYASPYRVSNPFDDLYSNNAPPMPLGPKPSESTSKKVLIEYTDNRECFADPEVGGVAIALTHGSVLFECAKHELHATTALKKPDRSNPTRISLVFYQHRSLNKSQHGLDEYTMKQKNKADTSNSDSVEFDSSFESVSLNSSLERVSGGEVAKRTPTMPTYSLTTMFPMYPCMVTGPYQEHYGGTLSIPHK